jgi:hypothetical protein
LNDAKPLTAKMQAALNIAMSDAGEVHAGTDIHNGRVVRTSASTMRALEARGLLVISVSPEGGLVGRPAK